MAQPSAVAGGHGRADEAIDNAIDIDVKDDASLRSCRGAISLAACRAAKTAACMRKPTSTR